MNTTLSDIKLESLHVQFPGAEWPEILAMESRGNHCSLRLCIDSSVRWFEGHFPSQAVLAGVVLTHWAASLATEIFSISAEFCGIDNLKFQRAVLPGNVLTLELSLSSALSIKFCYKSDNEICSEGKILFN